MGLKTTNSERGSNFERWYFESWHHYDRKRVPIRELYRDVLKWANRFASSELLNGKGKAALDVGCAHGYTVELLADLGYEAYGCDLSRFYLRTYAKKIARNLTVCDAHELPFRERYFSLVTVFELIEHVEDQYKFLVRCRECLKHDGVIVLQTPIGIPSIDGVLSRVYARAVSKSTNVENHINTMASKSELEHLLNRCGFKSHVETWFLIPISPTIFQRYFPTKIPSTVPSLRAVAVKQD